MLGFVASLHIPISLLPDTDIPEITVHVKLDDASSAEVEQTVLKPMRNQLRHLEGLEDIESTAAEGSGIIHLNFVHGTKTNLAFLEVNEKIDLAMASLPRRISRPQAIKTSASDIPAFYLNIRLRDDSTKSKGAAGFTEFSNFAQQVIRRRLEQLPEVAMADMTGIEIPEIQVIPDGNKLRTLGITEDNLQNILKENNLKPGNILVKDGLYQYYLQFPQGFYTIDDINNFYLNIHNRLWQLKEIATVRLQAAPLKGCFFSGQDRAVNIAVIKQSTARMTDLKKSMQHLINVFKKDYPNVIFDISKDQTALLYYSISNLVQDLVIGGLLAFLLMLAFVKKIRSALLIGVTIPISLLISQLVFYFAGLSVNIISLSGLILGLGMIIDNSIVVIDNITQYRDKEASLKKACITGTNEVIRPLITSVLTNCAVFVPLIFLSGIAGAIFYDQAIAITIGLSVSFIVAIILLPTLYNSLNAHAIHHHVLPKKNASSPILRGYEKGLTFVFSHPLLSISLVVLLLAIGVLIYPLLDKRKFPNLSKDDFEMVIDWNENLSVTENKLRILNLLHDTHRGIATSNTWISEQQYLVNKDYDLGLSECKSYIRAWSPDSVYTLQQQLLQKTQAAFPQASVSFLHAKTPFEQMFGEEEATLTVKIGQRDNHPLTDMEEVASIINHLKNKFPDAGIPPLAPQKRVVLETNFEKAALYNIEAFEIRNTLTSVFKPRQTDVIQGAQSLVNIVIGKANDMDISKSLSRTFIKNKTGVEFPLETFVTIRSETEYKSISGGARGEYYSMEIKTAFPKEIINEINSHIAKKHRALLFHYTGSYFYNRTIVREMAIILLISIALLYFILAAQFESLLQPAIILIELPIDITGALLLLYFSGSSINLMSLIGIIVMCGIIINDSVLKVDAINQLRRKGYALKDAIYEAGHKRFKSIIMISLTATGALLPTLFMTDIGSELQKPLALALIGGMLLGMFVSLFFTPLAYWLIYSKKNKV